MREREIRRSPVSPHQPGGEGGQQRSSPPGGAAGLPEGQHEEGLGEHDSLSHHVTGALQQGHQTDSCSHYRDSVLHSHWSRSNEALIDQSLSSPTDPD